MYSIFFFFFFQAEDGIRDFHVTGVQTCALPIYHGRRQQRGGDPGRPDAAAPQARGDDPRPAVPRRQDRLREVLPMEDAARVREAAVRLRSPLSKRACDRAMSKTFARTPNLALDGLDRPAGTPVGTAVGRSLLTRRKSEGSRVALRCESDACRCPRARPDAPDHVGGCLGSHPRGGDPPSPEP